MAVEKWPGLQPSIVLVIVYSTDQSGDQSSNWLRCIAFLAFCYIVCNILILAEQANLWWLRLQTGKVKTSLSTYVHVYAYWTGVLIKYLNFMCAEVNMYVMLWSHPLTEVTYCRNKWWGQSGCDIWHFWQWPFCMLSAFNFGTWNCFMCASNLKHNFHTSVMKHIH